MQNMSWNHPASRCEWYAYGHALRVAIVQNCLSYACSMKNALTMMRKYFNIHSEQPFKKFIINVMRRILVGVDQILKAVHADDHFLIHVNAKKTLSLAVEAA